MTLDDKKCVLLRYLLEGGKLTITIENSDSGKTTKEIIGLNGNDFGIYNDDNFTPVDDITFKQFLCLAESITEEELVYLLLNRQINNKVMEDDIVWM